MSGLGVGPLGQQARALQGAVQDPQGSHSASAEVLDREGRHLPGAHHDRPGVGETPELVVGDRGSRLDERVRCGADAGLDSDPASRARRRVEQRRQVVAGGSLSLGTSQRLAHLRVDLRLPEHHRVQPTGDREQVLRRVLVEVGVEGVGEVVGVDLARLAEEFLQRQEALVVAGDAREQLHPVAGREHHDALERVEVLSPPERLAVVVIGEGEPLEQLDRRATEGDPEGEDGHGSPHILPGQSRHPAAIVRAPGDACATLPRSTLLRRQRATRSSTATTAS